MASPFPFRPPDDLATAADAEIAPEIALQTSDSPRLGAGGKLRSARRSSIARSKQSPYHRPATGRHATPGGSTASAAATSYGKSIASRLVDSASRLITSSASYVFSSLFKRRQLAIANGGDLTGVVAEGQQAKPSGEAAVKHDDKHGASSDPGRSLVPNCATPPNRELDLGQVEGFLKQQTWSREEVNRLTEILQNRVHDNNAEGPKSEAQRWREQRKKAWDNSTPVEVARAYMGERTSRPSGTPVSFRDTPQQIDRVAEHEPLPAFGPFENRYRASPVLKTWAQSPSVVCMPRRSSILDSDLASGGPIRRNRHKTLALANSSPYARGLNIGTGPPRTLTSPPMQSSQTARKILETLEKLTPPPKEKALQEEHEPAKGSAPTKQTSATLEVRERKNMQNTKSSMLPILRESASSNGELALEVPAPIDSGKVEKPMTSSLIFTPGSPTVIPERSKGFRMSALFEESNSDDENLLDAKQLPSEERLAAAAPSEVKEVPLSGSSSGIKLAPLPVNVPSTASDKSLSMEKFIPVSASVSNAGPLAPTTMIQCSSFPPAPLQPVGSSDFHALPSVVAASSASSEKPALFSSSSFPTFSPSPTAMEAKPPLFSSPFPTFSFPSVPTETRLPVSSALLFVNGPVGVSVSQAAAPSVDAHVPPSSALPATGPMVARVSVPSAVTASTGVSLSEITVSHVSSAPTAAAVSQASASVSQAAATGGLLSSIVSEASAALVDAGESLPSPASPAAIVDLFEVENGATMATEGPGSDKLADGDTMATDPMAEEPDTFNMPSSTPAFSFGPSSAVSSVSPMPTFSFGVSSMSSPSSTFTVQSAGAPTTPSFAGQSGTSSAGQLFAFGASASTQTASPFSLSRTANSTPTFTFGSSSSVANTSVPSAFTFGSSSAASSSASIFPATSSSLPSFSVTASAPSTFSFGPHASSSLPNSSSAGSIFRFGVQQTPQTASPFNASGAANSSPAFTFGSVPTAVSSAAPTFSFGAGVSTSLSSASSFAAQSFTFGGQATPIASPFSQTGNSNSAPTFPFGSSSSSVPAFSFGSSSASSPSPNFAFGAQSATPFTFGSQTGASLTGQPFGLGAQPTAPAQISFSSTAASNTFTQPGLEFNGGFALGASGGDKRDRKIIKPRRTASAKRGK